MSRLGNEPNHESRTTSDAPEPLTESKLLWMEGSEGNAITRSAASEIRELWEKLALVLLKNKEAAQLISEITELIAENAKLRANQRLRCWNCPCGDLVFRDTHYDLECGKCKRVQVDADEFMPDVEIHKLRAKLEVYGQHLLDCMLTCVDEFDPDRGFKISGKWQKEKPACTCGLDDALDGKDDK